MRKIRYTGAHTAEAVSGTPKRQSSSRPKKREKPFVLRARLHKRQETPGHEKRGLETEQERKRTGTGLTPKRSRIPDRPPRTATNRADPAMPPRTGHIRVERPAFMERKRWKPSRRLIFFAAAIVAALLLGAVAIASRQPIDAGVYEKNMAKAIEAYDQADLDNALRYLRRAASVEETDECLKLMATCYEKTGMLDKALELLRSVDASDTWASEEIQRLEQQRALQRTADTVTVLGILLPPDSTDLVLDERNLRDEDLAEIVQLYALDSLSLIDNQIRDFSPLAQLGSLDILNLSGNRISDLSPLSGMTGLRELYLDRNPLSDLTPLYGLSNLTLLSIQGCGVEENERAALAAALPACAILSDAEEENILVISLGGQTFRSDVEELDLSSCGVRDISVLALCKELTRLDLSGNEISNLQGLMNLPKLNTLNISSNQVSDLRPLMGIETLYRLKAADNALTDTSALSTMTALQTLDLSGNPIADFSGLRHLSNLSSLNVAQTGLQDEDLYYLSCLTTLKKLVLDDNPDLGNEAYGVLKSNLPDCSISHTELVYTIKIEGVSVESNVTELDLSGLEIEDLSGLERLNCLERLNLSRNRISNLYALQISASRSSLLEVNLSFNQLSNLSPLSALTGLERLNLYGNPLNGIHVLKSMDSLRWLNVGSCGLTDDQIFELQFALPNCEIVLDA